MTPTISAGAAAQMRGAIRLAEGREVCFVGTVHESVITSARAVARGDATSVLALPGVAQRGEMLLHNHPSGALIPSEADSLVAHQLYLDGIGFGIINNEATELYVVVEIPQPREITPLDLNDVAAELGGAGAVGRVISEHEERESQKLLAAAIAGLYNNGGIGVLEAGTGVGKSLAYLLPALRWSARNGERTVVSTNTINLQEQIFGKDLPLLARALTDQKVSFTLLKGWRNYLCLQRLDNALTQPGSLFDSAGEEELRALADWSLATTNGSLADLAAQPRQEVWDEIAAEPDLCTRQKCSYFDECFLFKARREAAAASVVVVNHHLLMADLTVRRSRQNWSEGAVLPWYNRLIIDEAHHLEEAAARHLGSGVSRRAVQRMFGRLDRKGKGLLRSLLLQFANSRSAVNSASHDLVEERLLPSVAIANRLAVELFDILDEVLLESGENTLRLTSHFTQHRAWSDGLGESLDSLTREITLLSDATERLRNRLTSVETGEGEIPVLAELRGVVRRLGAAGDALNDTLRPAAGVDRVVRWIEHRTLGRTPNVTIASVPLDLSDVLRDDLFGRVTTSVLTSATLSVGGSFTFVKERLGLEHGDVNTQTSTFSSPFHYGDQALLAVPGDIPAPNEDGEGHIKAALNILLTFADLSDGGLFVLCTSHRDVRTMSAGLRSARPDSPWPLMVHGEGEPRHALLQRFRASGRGILFGTSSFWEGVDVKGDALRGLLITRLPFRVPTEPVTAATCEAIAQGGGDPFNDYLLPHAALRLRQGFGRLIRSSFDWGAVVIADPRLLNRPYGEMLLDSLPPARRAIGPWSQVSAELRKFYQERRRL